MAQAGRIYRLSTSGRRAWEKEDATVPAAFRRILGMLETETHTDVVRGYLRRFPDQLILEWLAELGELGLVESRPAKSSHDLDCTGNLKRPQRIAEDRAGPGRAPFRWPGAPTLWAGRDEKAGGTWLGVNSVG